MSRITWTVPGTRFFESGVDRGVLYVGDNAGIPWIGLTSVEEKPSGAESQPYYIDGVKYLNLSTLDEFEATISAYTYPTEFSECDGSARIRAGLNFGQQRRQSFGFSYRTMIGNDVSGPKMAYKLHLVYNALALPSSRTASSIGESAEAFEFSWDLTTRSVPVSGSAPTAHVTIDSRETNPYILSLIENILYGSNDTVARIPSPSELVEIFDTPLNFTVTDNGAGQYTVAVLTNDVLDLGDGSFLINHSTVVVHDANTSTISD